jgi:IS5 family transposase
MKQASFAGLAFDAKKKTTKRDKFLAEMDKVVPWSRLQALIEPYYPKAGNGRPPLPLAMMLRVYCLQQWYGLSDPGMEEALYDMESMRRFAGIELIDEAVPDETSILNFRRLLETHELTAKIFAEVVEYLEEHKLLLRQGTIVDATIIAAPPSTRNADRKRDPEMSATRKGNNWHFGMKAHIGVDAKRGLVHTVVVTTASEADINIMDELLHGDEQVVYGDKGYAGEERRQALREKEVRWGVLAKAARGRSLTEHQEARNKRLSSIRAKVEHPFRVVKRQFNYLKVRYRGIAKNAAHVFSLFALSNLYMARRRILTLQARCAR